MKKEKRKVVTSADFEFDPKVHAHFPKWAVNEQTGERLQPMSLTVPDESTSLKKLVEFAERNNVQPRAAAFGSYGNPDFDSPDLEKMAYMDEVDRGLAIQALSEQLAEYEASMNALEKKAIAAKKETSDRMKKMMDKLDALYERDPGAKEELEKP